MSPPFSELEKILSSHLQKEITISVDGSEIKKGKFLIFQNNILANNFFYDLTIERIKKIDIFRIPYPFKIDHYPADGLLYLDYRFSSLTVNKKHTTRIQHLVEKYTDTNLKQSKLLNKIIEIEFK